MTATATATATQRTQHKLDLPRGLGSFEFNPQISESYSSREAQRLHDPLRLPGLGIVPERNLRHLHYLPVMSIVTVNNRPILYALDPATGELVGPDDVGDAELVESQPECLWNLLDTAARVSYWYKRCARGIVGKVLREENGPNPGHSLVPLYPHEIPRLLRSTTTETWWVSGAVGMVDRLVGFTFGADRFDVVGRDDGQWSIDVQGCGGARTLASRHDRTTDHVSIDVVEPARALFRRQVADGPCAALGAASRTHIRWISAGEGRTDRRGRDGKDRLLVEVRRCKHPTPAWTIYRYGEDQVARSVARVRATFAAQEAGLRLAQTIAGALLS